MKDFDIFRLEHPDIPGAEIIGRWALGGWLVTARRAEDGLHITAAGATYDDAVAALVRAYDAREDATLGPRG